VRAVDTNVLIFAEITSSAQHQTAKRLLSDLAQGSLPWAIPWPCVYEFLRVVTHRRIYQPPVPLELALGDLRSILASPSLLLLQETENHLDIAEKLMLDAGVSGNLVHDAHIAALCLEHGVSELLTGDRDFRRFTGLRVVNPF
jgi:toxin-antitoxin system PIN domain toxin